MRSRFGSVGGLIVLAWAGVAFAASATQPASERISTIRFPIPAAKAGAESNAIVALPAGYLAPEAAGTRWPVVYLLHGYSGNQEDWYKHTAGTGRALDVMASRYGVIIVLPDGKYSSWYLDAAPDAPQSADWQWETVITRHLVPEIDRRWRTWAEPAGRGITGLSMGGHGAMYLCARHPELFSACGTMSGVMDLRPLGDRYDLPKRLGPYNQAPKRWEEASVIGLADRFAGRKAGILIECGLGDSTFIGGNQALHRKLLDLNIPHDYIERPGAHTWEYWINALPYHLQFLSDRLKRAGTP
jgi:S-formylglutathione hydrolase FrmB